MVEHTCTRCNKSFPKLWKLKRHNERQYKCRPNKPKVPQPEDRRKEKPKVVDPSVIEQQEDLIFEECPVGRDLERPHMNRSSMSKWIGK
ncbi:18212_t:CDS:2, partial [Funneliformis geosporum]